MHLEHDECNNSGIIALLDLPKGSVIHLDGAPPMILQRHDFVGWHSIPTTHHTKTKGSLLQLLHAVFVRAGAKGVAPPGKMDDLNGPNRESSATTVGFLFCEDNSTDLGHPQQPWTFLRKYDPFTEEVSAVPLADERFVAETLRRQIRESQMAPQRMIAYHQVVSESSLDRWHRLTSHVSRRVLEKRCISNGEKLVPGSYSDPEENLVPGCGTADSLSNPTLVADGTSVLYPAIPVFGATNPDTVPQRHKIARHAGTRRFLQDVSPADRTTLFLSPNPATAILEQMLVQEYNGVADCLLGDFQLAFVLFVHLHCYASLVHWRDLLAMMSYVPVDGMARHQQLYQSLLAIVAAQVETVEDDFLDDVEFAGDNFLTPALQQLMATTKSFKAQCPTTSESLQLHLSTLESLLSNKFPLHFGNQDSEGLTDEISSPIRPWSATDMDTKEVESEDDDDSDGPVVVSIDEVESSLDRSLQLAQQQRMRHACPDATTGASCKDLASRYPFLFAAMNIDTEDILMTCARILDEAVDVTLVREAAAYLQEVEALRNYQE
jgi:AAR2 protein